MEHISEYLQQATEVGTMREDIERALQLLATGREIDTQEARIQLYEALGCVRGDAQGIVEAEDNSR
jgi:RNase adaptor protein for sRNA GlmZ degradation